ncbi:MAG: bifunctional diaminohydroxyphosphoribosylaminopyrimidine deaminase/5-amino-6-(5-phosphoribosylamino)uracil reductase RibD [Tannerella sp.]|jgi:diaminohydroxyphosphoribosylaminopyrimidine deaminase/5-amino-6-(5-phosphoribosylamino)uracil reductase|nr:bifunctional diaminohydroxyphosphoribosylaminopyrimidine deaminase/5-amino-6-(5-phosphoribosylamino)uracil reductase RibD [Tannerella sp.]
MLETAENKMFMNRCLDLAKGGKGLAAPNPMVGAVIVHGDRIIGEGFHHCYGEAHAEVNAIRSVREEDRVLLKNSTLYVSLEPCSHYGKTPPCAELIIRTGIPRVVLACLDPYHKVSGRGVKMLQDANIEVVTGTMEQQALELNRYYMTVHQQKRPYIILKWAQSEDGFLDKIRTGVSEKPVQLSSPVSQIMLHKLRSENQAIMVGTNTAILDNPSLTVRHWIGKSPLRILIDRDLKVPAGYHLLDGTTPTLVITGKEAVNQTNIEYVHVADLPDLMKLLYARNINSLLVEGGATLHRSFINADLWDEIMVETVPKALGSGVKAAELNNCENLQLFHKKKIPFFTGKSTKYSLLDVYRRRCFN